MKKILPIFEPLFSKNMHLSPIFSIVKNHSDYLNWIYTECIQVKYDTNYNNFSQNSWAKTCPLIIYQKINRDILSGLNCFDIINFLKAVLNKNTYILLAVNHRYIKQSIATDQDIIHTLFIYGYDDSNNTLYLCDHFFDKATKYNKAVCSYNEFIDAFTNIDNASHTWPWGGFLIRYLELYEVDYSVKYSLNLKKIYCMVNDYITDNEITDGCAHGIKCYEFLLRDLDIFINKGIKKSDIQNFLFLWQQKMSIVSRYNHLYGMGVIPSTLVNDLKDIERYSRIILNLLLKYEITNKKDIIYKAKDMLEQIRGAEQKALLSCNEYMKFKVN